MAKAILQGIMKGGRRQDRQKMRWEDNLREWSSPSPRGQWRTEKKMEEIGCEAILLVPQRRPLLRNRWRWKVKKQLVSNGRRPGLVIGRWGIKFGVLKIQLLVLFSSQLKNCDYWLYDCGDGLCWSRWVILGITGSHQSCFWTAVTARFFFDA